MRPGPFTRRSFLSASAASAGLLAGRSLWAAPLGANERINVGIIGLGWRGGEHLDSFSHLPEVRIAAICDVDQERLDAASVKHPDALAVTDLRRVIENEDIDAVVIATCNHWHCLAAIWACQAGKDVYVEKPLGHTIEEQRRLVEVARFQNRIVQVGTQQRSDPMQAEIRQFLHGDQGIGKLQHVVVSRIGKRPPIGKRATPLVIPKTVDYDLWLGPASDETIYRNQFHYDWHWVWNTGNGEMGNWGVHILDDARNVALLDEVRMPSAVYSTGTRVAFDDAGETPNVQVAYFANDRLPIYMMLSNVGPAQTMKRSIGYRGDNTGYVVFGEGGQLRATRARAVAVDADGKKIREFRGDAGMAHQANFLAAMRSRDRSQLATDVEMGHLSSAWCHLASMAALEEASSGGPAYAPEEWSRLIEGYAKQVAQYDPSTSAEPSVGRVVVDSRSEEVQAPASALAASLWHRAYRAPYGEQDF